MLGFSPKFVKAKVSIRLGEETVVLGEHLVNADGVPPFAWTQFDPMEMVGTKTTATVQSLTTPPIEFTCEAYLTAERTTKETNLAVIFELTPSQRKPIDESIAVAGTLPEFARKSPRIPFTEQIKIMPSHGIVRFFHKQEDVSIACDIDDFSPSGFQFRTEDQRAAGLVPGTTVRVQLQPRGDYRHAISANAAVQRIIYKINSRTSNPEWHFGMSVTTMSAEHKMHFTELLRMIVTQMKS